MTYAAPRDARSVPVLLVEDSESDVRLTREALAEVGSSIRLAVVGSGEEALRYLRREAPFTDAESPRLVLLDLNIPGMGGRETLRAIKRDESLRVIPVVVLTTSTKASDVDESYESLANSFVTKPIELDEFVEMIRAIQAFWLSTVSLPRR